MSFLTAVLLGLVQGITEFLPVSSSGHLALLQNVFHIDEADLMFDVMLHVGTLIAIFMVYKSDVRDMLRGFTLLLTGRGGKRAAQPFRLRRRLALLVLSATLPLLIAVPFAGKVEELTGNTVVIGILLILNGIMLHVSDRGGVGRKELKEMSILDAILIGLGQVVSVLPGISRSGTTMSVGLGRGLSRSYTVRFSFLLSIPAVLGAAAVQLVSSGAGFDVSMIPMYLVGMIASAVSGYFSIRILKWLAARSSFSSFAYYCWGAGIIALILSLVA